MRLDGGELRIFEVLDKRWPKKKEEDKTADYVDELMELRFQQPPHQKPRPGLEPSS